MMAEGQIAGIFTDVIAVPCHDTEDLMAGCSLDLVAAPGLSPASSPDSCSFPLLHGP